VVAWGERRPACPETGPSPWGVGVVPYPPGGKQSRHSARSLAAEIVAIYLRWLSDYLRYYLPRYLISLASLLDEVQCDPTAVQWLLKDAPVNVSILLEGNRNHSAGGSRAAIHTSESR
jgi:hypothetical protein